MGCIFLTGKAFQKIRRREIGNWGCHQSAQDSEPEGICLITPPPPHLHPQYPVPLGMLSGPSGKVVLTGSSHFGCEAERAELIPKTSCLLRLLSLQESSFNLPEVSWSSEVPQKPSCQFSAYTMGVPTVLFLSFVPMPPPPHMVDWVC